MKKIALLLLIFVTTNSFVQNEEAFQTGEWFKLRIHYGMINAGYATLEIKEATRSNKKVHHVVGKGWTVGMAKLFFKVEDDYQSYFDKETGKPYQFIRKIDEGGYTKNQIGYFNQNRNTVLVKDYKKDTEKTFSVPDNVQDIVSSFYFLRNHPQLDNLKVGESIVIDMFFDDETFKFKLKYIGNEDLKTKFGTVPCKVFRPYVQAGRVFKEEESLTVWISNDENRIPIRIKASLAVGSLKADLEAFKGLKNSFKIKVEN
ncbi:DUF3108 domain-containing protein [Flavobacterium sp. NRK F10]|uniref:DUF3108 domain-containing protein n=1 Tax=Flavobacterium sediminis TaxID=2201181 RepID=A0A2U8QTU8_9FLAO|nr:MULTISPECIES: DUF3108 domain-containing protein [Flavobacterium]AWM13509.1 DUF3108 domain-containing protein [Flavobacterium sediminis]MCO6174623.1 DUF3108 domain-containing protein [Flavobacterium sp. NRK F10]